MREYSREDMHQCLQGQRVLFVGDSATRVLFFAALTRLEHEASEWLLRTTFTEADPRHDLSIESEDIQLDFIWDPWLNSTAFLAEMGRFPHPSDTPHDDSNNAIVPPKLALTLVGSPGLIAARNAGESYFEIFRAATSRVVHVLGDFVHPSSENDDPLSSNVFLAPVTVPRYEMLPPGRAEALSPARIRRMNDYLHSLPNTAQSHILSAYNEMTYHVLESYEDTGLHVTGPVAERWIDIPLNARCNGFLAQADDRVASFAHQTTCCTPYPKCTRGQTWLWYGLVVLFLAPVVLYHWKGQGIASSFVPFSIVSATVLFCFIADRSHALAKSEKHFSPSWLYCLLVISAGAFAVSKRHIASHQPGGPTATKNGKIPPPKSLASAVDFLPRQLSDEWKGIMQAVFLLLVYQDQSKMPIIDRWAAFVTNAFLFLSTFGHASYFLKFEDYSFRRVSLVLFRLNLLPCLVALMLDGRASGIQDSVSHLYIVSRLVSFWFLVTYFTLRLGSHTNSSQPDFLLLRICISSVLVLYGVLTPGQYGVLDFASWAANYCCGAVWPADDMRSAIYLYWSAPYCGMAVATIAHRAALISRVVPVRHAPGETDEGVITDSDCSARLDRLLFAILHPDEFTEPLQPIFILFCFVFFCCFASVTTFMHLGETAVEGSPHLQQHITVAAVVCVAVLRNFHTMLRTSYLHWAAALGKIALELLVLHNHIWLSGNGTGRLRLFSIYPMPTEEGTLFDRLYNTRISIVQYAEIISISTVFLAVSWQCHRTTRRLAAMLFRERLGETPSATNGHSDGTKTPYMNDCRHELPRFEARPASTSRGLQRTLLSIASRAGFRAASVLFLLCITSKYYV